MLLSQRLSLPTLIEMCRSMRYSLKSGLMLRETMELLADKGTRPIRPVAQKLLKDLKAGWWFQDALKKQEACFPPLFLALTAVGEESGNLPEVLTELESYYLMQQKLYREFKSQITWPILQLTAAIFVIAGLIFVLGMVAVRNGPNAVLVDPLGVGLVGTKGAIIFLALVLGTGLLFVAGFLLTRHLCRRKAGFERLLLYVPAIGPCLRAMAMTRFCVALQLMLETSLSIVKTMRLAFQATDNAAFIAALPRAEATLRQGNTVATSLQAAGIFPEKFLSTIAIAEQSGRLPEVLQHQAEELDEEAKGRLGFLNQVASYLVWMIVAFIIILAIFRIFTIVYLGNIEKYIPH